ncbi:hypothetical protein K6Y74_30395 [Burkholderia cenocepacia]|uniref:hypothetical protein n=1 Tax=Burkholderia cenocepacia TaxID=95486 RepID=UPI00078CD36E|nr:hypothetical protein [Burkholderia cenocepacia]AMU15798.1 hypothetical protein A3203_23155 [Burkholderia cenocepacia]MCW3585772.1 hypothetical protein [Burkholderia cenocepacia]MCW3631020.1 hypothetical protein [Burkholderia cenocepacia]MCW3647588.1 hypothetical protein [Burkholderia cenocepacia]MCW5180543.1 hypothetical protein [Burkholderia cenocepacia]
MRVLFFLEPVIFRDLPSLISAHFHWVEYFRLACRSNDWHFALTANDSTCAQWAESHPDATDVALYPINPFTTLASFDHTRKRYAKAAYADHVAENPLTNRLKEIRKQFTPTLVVMSSQSTFARQAFSGIPILSIEQAPLPRLGHPIRTAFDPCGHQTSSLLETHANEIRGHRLPPKTRQQSLDLLNAIRHTAVVADSRGMQAIAALEDIRRDGPVALLVTQPTDAVTYEGAYEAVELENLLYAWAEALPPGWIGVPTYHAGQRLTEEMERVLAAATPRLRFLPQQLSQSFSEPLLTAADGMVTISSTCAMAGLLFQKRVVVVGRAPYNAWCSRDPAQLDTTPVLSDDEAASLLCFLTHRLAISHDVLDRDITPLTDLMRAVVKSENPSAWLTDLSTWTPEQANTLFHFRACVGSQINTQGCLRTQLEQQLSDAVTMRDVYESEWKAAVADRDRIKEILASTADERDTLLNRLSIADDERKALEHDLASQRQAVESRLTIAVSKQAELLCATSMAAAERDAARIELIAITQARDALRDELAHKLDNWEKQSISTLAEHAHLQEMLTSAHNENERLNVALSAAEKRCTQLLREKSASENERDTLQAAHDVLADLQTRLNRQLEQAASCVSAEQDRFHALMREHARTSDELSAAIQEREQLVAEKAALEQDVASAHTALAEFKRKHDAEQASHQSLRDDHARLTARYLEQSAQLDALQSSQAALKTSHEQIATQLAAAVEELEGARAELTACLEWMTAYRRAVAALPRWRLMMHYKTLSRDDTPLDLPARPHVLPHRGG